mmetsp:Transcript_9385/g.16940  ORF Transcript_9385/g.16940 Transcript_9385/m.16940 type:complete len:204 (-) Transcript_9385:982-1593(-)
MMIEFTMCFISTQIFKKRNLQTTPKSSFSCTDQTQSRCSTSLSNKCTPKSIHSDLNIPQIRKLIGSDFNKIIELDRQTWKSTFWSEQSYLEELQRPLTDFIGAFCESELIGILCLWTILDEGHITNLIVHPQYRRIGIGTKLVNEIITKYAQSRSLNVIMLEVRQSNFSAIRLYSSCKFTIMSIRKHYYDNPQEDAILLSLHL